MEKYFYRPELEQELWRQIQTRLPDRIFDTHCHLYPAAMRSYAHTGGRDADAAFWRREMAKMAGDERLAGAMIMPSIVAPEQASAVNAFVRDEAAKYRGFCVAHLIQPDDDREETERLLLANPVITTLKPYFRYCPDRWASTFDKFFPEWMAELADRYGLSVTLHLAREREALADPQNHRLIRKYCEKYPNMRLILAHNGLGHNVENLRRGLPHICGYPNIWFDSSGVSESASHSYILEYFGPKRLMYGSDLPLGGTLGKIHSVGNGLMCSFENRTDFKIHFASEQYITTMYEFNTECMLALLTAADQWGLSREDLADIFYNNAAWVYRLQYDGSGPAAVPEQYDRTRFGQALSAEDRPLAVAGVFSTVYTADNTPFLDTASPAARDCPLGFRDHAATAAARLGAASGLPGSGGADAYAQMLGTLHSWSEGAAVTASPEEAMALAIAVARAATGRETVVLCSPEGFEPVTPIEAVRCAYGNLSMVESALSPVPAALILPREGFFFQDAEFLRKAVGAAREAGAAVIYDEQESGFRRRPGILDAGVPVPDLCVYGAAAANGYEMGAVVARGPLWKAMAGLSWRRPGCHAVAAALAVLSTPRETYDRLEQAAAAITAAWENAAAGAGIPIRIVSRGLFPRFVFTGVDPEALRREYVRRMALQGVIADTFAYIKSTDSYATGLERIITRAFKELAASDVLA